MGGQAFNKTVGTLLDFALRKKLIDIGNNSDMERTKLMGQNAMGLESYRTQNDASLKFLDADLKDKENRRLAGEKQQELMTQWIDKVSVLPQIQQLGAAMFKKEANGEDVEPLRQEYRKVLASTATSSLRAIKGDAIDENDVGNILTLAETTGNKLFDLHRNAIKDKQDSALGWAKQGTDQFQADTSRMTAEQNAGGPWGKSKTADLSMIQQIYQSVQTRRKDYSDDSGRDFSGEALSKIAEIKLRRSKGMPMRERDSIFLSDVTDPEMVKSAGSVAALYGQPNLPDEQAALDAAYTGGSKVPEPTAAQAPGSKQTAPAPAPTTQAPPPPVAAEGKPDQFGYVVGSQMSIPSGANAGTWQYMGNNSWQRVK